ncbi:MAG: hypothetical protein HY286_19230 [Planctomycetes bacterium]|nr:hypothetical protein [Planctomycetota bacterium]
MKKLFIASVVASFVSAIVIIIFLNNDASGGARAGGGGNSNPPKTNGRAGARAETSAAFAEAKRAAVESPPAEPICTIRVVSTEADAPISGASVYRADKLARLLQIDSDRCSYLGVTDARGALAVPADMCNITDREAIVACAGGYCLNSLAHPPKTADLNYIRLQPARTLRIECKDTAGFPLPGAIVSLSPIAVPRTIGDRNASTDACLAGADPRTAIYSSATDSKGGASFDTLPAGTFGIWVDKRGYCKISGPNICNPESPTPPEEFRLGRALAAVVSASGGKFISYSGEGDGASLAADPAAARIRAELEKMYPSSLVFTGRETIDGSRSIRLKFLAADLTVIAYTAELYELDDPRVLQKIELPSGSGAHVPAADVHIRIVDASGAECAVDDCYLMFNVDGNSFRAGPVKNDNIYRLPAATLLTPTMSNGAVARKMKEGGLYIPDSNATELTIHIHCRLRRCRFALETETGALDVNAALFISIGESKFAFALDAAANNGLWLPVGSTKVIVKSLGIESAETSIEVLESSRGGDQNIPVRVHFTNRAPSK